MLEFKRMIDGGAIGSSAKHKITTPKSSNKANNPAIGSTEAPKEKQQKLCGAVRDRMGRICAAQSAVKQK